MNAGTAARRWRVLLVGNYEPDDQRSMQRFAELLEAGLLTEDHEVRVVRPRPVLRRWLRAPRELAKLAGHLDKMILFPRRLRAEAEAWRDAGGAAVVHLADHGNAFWLSVLRAVPHVVTVHDLMAVRGALGELPGARPRASGRVLQRRILRGLGEAREAVCVSASTARDLRRLVPAVAGRTRVVPNALNTPFRPLAPEAAAARLAEAGCRDLAEGAPFLLHVGSDAWYKNREGLVRIAAAVFAGRAEGPGSLLVTAGVPLGPAVRAEIARLGIASRVRDLGPVRPAVLEALYARAAALVFPSWEEGFGWPPLEAQACGCPVVTTRGGSLPEVVGDTALVADPGDEAALAALVRRVLDEPGEADRLRAAGRANVRRFSVERMVAGYRRAYARARGRDPDDEAPPEVEGEATDGGIA